MYCGESLPLHPDDEDLSYAVRDSDWEGKEVEFEIVPYDGNIKISKGWGGYAKLIPSKEQQKQLITEIMEEDANDGLYDHIVDTNEMLELPKLLDEMGEPDDDFQRSYKVGFEEGYLKAKETLYTEEDVIRTAIHCWNIASKPEYGKTYNVNEIVKNYIQSLKQHK